MTGSMSVLLAMLCPTPHKWKWSVDLPRGGAPLREPDAPASASACSAGSPTPVLMGSPCPGSGYPGRGWASSDCPSASPVFPLPSVPLPVVWPPLSPGSNSEMPWRSSTPAGKAAASTSLSNQSTGPAGLARAQGPAFSLAWWFDWSLTLTLLGPSI